MKPSYDYGFRIIYDSSPVVYNLLEDHNPLKGNTVGSRSDIEMAYIAGFLDGDGSVMLQIKKRSDSVRGYRFMATICFYQDSRHDTPLAWIRSVFGVGYLTKRNDGMSELRINGFETVLEILRDLQPFIRFKKLQIEAAIKANHLLSESIRTLSKRKLLEIVELMLVIQRENYMSHNRKTREELLKILDLTP